MDISNFLSALLAIVLIDLVLAGDNAIVIALATRSLPPDIQKRAILWGTAGAIAVRSMLTLVVVWLLKIPGLMVAGGLLLLRIAYKLMLPDGGDGESHAVKRVTFWGAMQTIIVADTVMGLDNVLAVAGAAQGNYTLVVIGLAVSVPIVVWGSTIVLKWVERFPVIIYIGSGVLVWTAVKMVLGEPLVKVWFDAHPAVAWSLFALVPLVLFAGFVKNHRHFESRVHARLKQLEPQWPAKAMPSSKDARVMGGPSPFLNPSAKETLPMLNILVPVDGSDNAMRAVDHAIRSYQTNHALKIHLLNVQPKLSKHVAQFVARKDRQAWHLDQARKALSKAEDALRSRGVPFDSDWTLGDRVEVICATAKRLNVDHIVLGTARRHSITRMLEDSTTHRLLNVTPVPVEVVTGGEVSRAERWGVPAATVAALGTVAALAID